ncbi:MAG TPA: LPS export ABC transporter periplasmic protein LptC [Wenzhouxiangellaceae bacterium]|nr:LPS export ABC transporter periplasmic protein LptC [Wenzhouxiangellaceae bacterium]
MNRRRYWLLFVFALAVLVTGNWWLDQTWQPETPAPEAVEQDIDYALGDFEAQFFDTEGTLTLDVAGPRLEHDAVTRQALIPEPRFVIDPAGQAWAGTAEMALVERDSRRLTLQGDVHIEKPHPRGTIQIESDEIQYDRSAATLHSPGPAVMRQDGTELTGGTLTAWIDEERMELDQDVQGIYRPARAAARD